MRAQAFSITDYCGLRFCAEVMYEEYAIVDGSQLIEEVVECAEQRFFRRFVFDDVFHHVMMAFDDVFKLLFILLVTG